MELTSFFFCSLDWKTPVPDFLLLSFDMVEEERVDSISVVCEAASLLMAVALLFTVFSATRVQKCVVKTLEDVPSAQSSQTSGTALH